METPIDAVTASLAVALEGAASAKAAQKAFQTHLKQLAPLRTAANAGEIESFYIVTAWFSPYRFTPIVLAQHYGIAGDDTVVGSSRSITAITNLNRAWGSSAISKLREALQEDVPLPNWPKRDFLETLNKIANTGYKLDSLVQHLPPFLSTKLRTAPVPDRPYFRQQGLRRVIRSDLDEFYKTVVEPTIVDSLSGGAQRKRRKTSISGRRTRANARDEEVELPRRLDVEQLAPDETIVPDSSPVSARSSSSSRSRLTEPLIRLRTASQGDGSLHTQGLRLQGNSEPIPTDEDAITLPLLDDHESSIFNNADMLRRTPDLSSAAAEATQDVRDTFNDFHRFASGMNPAVQWLIDFSTQQVEQKSQLEIAVNDLKAIEGEISKLETVVSRKVPSGMKLPEAIDAAQLDLDNFETLYDEALAQQRATESLTSKLISAGLCFLNAHIQIDEKSAMTERAGKEQRLKELRDLDSSLTAKMEEQTEKQAVIQRLEGEHVQLKKDMEYTRAIFDLVQNPLTLEALAALKTVTSVEEHARGR